MRNNWQLGSLCIAVLLAAKPSLAADMVTIGSGATDVFPTGTTTITLPIYFYDDPSTLVGGVPPSCLPGGCADTYGFAIDLDATLPTPANSVPYAQAGVTTGLSASTANNSFIATVAEWSIGFNEHVPYTGAAAPGDQVATITLTFSSPVPDGAYSLTWGSSTQIGGVGGTFAFTEHLGDGLLSGTGTTVQIGSVPVELQRFTIQ